MDGVELMGYTPERVQRDGEHMIVLHGRGVCNGIVFGELKFYKRGRQKVVRRHIEDITAELERYEKAKTLTLAKLEQLYQKALVEVGGQDALIFNVHQMMLDDDDYCDSIINIIKDQRVCAEYAISVTGKNFSKMFSEMDDAYLKERAADVRDISDQLIGTLSGEGGDHLKFHKPCIIAADDLAPSETVQMDKSKILSIITEKGSINSHTAILARTMGIPAIIGMEGLLNDEYDGTEVIVDGYTGMLYILPDEQTKAKLQSKLDNNIKTRNRLEQLRGKRNVTLDGKEIMVYANIGNPSDLGSVIQNDAGGIGLFRSEFLFLEKSVCPTEQEQFTAYKTVLETMAGKRVIIRTLDIGADKQADYLNMDKEENPAMGLRAIRICLTRPEIFKTQLKALYRASAFGKLAIMFPMITSVSEVQQIKIMIQEVCDELTDCGIPFADDIELGIMIETPAAAVISDLLAAEVDFFSIGTNDLTQYTLAVDRQNQKVEQFCDTHHEAVLRLIKLVIDYSHQAGIWTGICGELAGDLSLTETFIKMGVDELSVSPPLVLTLRDKIRNLKID